MPPMGDEMMPPMDGEMEGDNGMNNEMMPDAGEQQMPSDFDSNFDAGVEADEEDGNDHTGHDLLAEDQEQHDQRHGDDHNRRHHCRNVFSAKAVFPYCLNSV